MNAQAPRILITGVGRRIGAHLASHCLDRGWQVTGSCRDRSTPTVRALVERGMTAIECELTDPASVAAMADRVRADGRLHALVHNASVWHRDAQVAESPRLAEELFAVHVRTPWALSEALAPLLDDPDHPGNIVFITDANIAHGKPEHMLYLATKAGAESLVRSMARRHAPGIRVNGIAPGLILFHPEDDEQYRQRRLAKRLLPFEPGPSVIAQSLDYLLDCPYLTGTVLRVDGGKL
ncbi:MAG: SDR family oxidoreductase [Halothiobacillaceae bacterium]